MHIQPQGDIKIFNMWGQERGVIPVNRQTMFGKPFYQKVLGSTLSLGQDSGLWLIWVVTLPSLHQRTVRTVSSLRQARQILGNTVEDSKSSVTSCDWFCCFSFLGN